MQPRKAESVLGEPFAADVNAGAVASDDFTTGGTLMKKMLLLVTLGMVSASFALAQDSSTAGQAATPGSNTSAGANTVRVV